MNSYRQELADEDYSDVVQLFVWDYYVKCVRVFAQNMGVANQHAPGTQQQRVWCGLAAEQDGSVQGDNLSMCLDVGSASKTDAVNFRPSNQVASTVLISEQDAESRGIYDESTDLALLMQCAANALRAHGQQRGISTQGNKKAFSM